nr:HAMP domain-containing sensor histidine kinase [uncultured Sphingomonas sp.]
MASAPGGQQPIIGKVDRDGRLIEADGPLLRLQQEAGAALGVAIALPQLAAVVRSARKLGVPLARSVLVASADHDLDLWVRAEPSEDGVRLIIEGWQERPIAPPRLMLIAGGKIANQESNDSGLLGFETDSELRFTRVSSSLARLLGDDGLVGQPVTRHFHLVEAADGLMPLLMALGAREDFGEQVVELKTHGHSRGILSGTALIRRGGRFAGFDAELKLDESVDADEIDGGDVMFDPAIDDALRSPLDEIIKAADRIVERSDGPLRSDYATYASDIAAAGRHLLSVLRSMNAEAAADMDPLIDLGEVTAEAVALVAADAEDRQVEIRISDAAFGLPVAAEKRAVLQILVNILGNAVRHSPDGAMIDISFSAGDQRIGVAIADQGPGIAAKDHARIFEKYEQGDQPGSSGLGLPISRRLARSLGGEVLLESAPGRGARFILVLPRA